MGNTFFDPGERRAARVNELFTRIARRYDLINDVQSFGLHRGWKRKVVELSCARAGERALDVCCGTGDLAFLLSESGVQTVGLDFTGQMLALAATKFISQRGPPRHTPHATRRSPCLIRGDAQKLPFPNATFDTVTVGYGLRNLADWKVGLGEMCRVAKPGGRLLVLDFGKPDNAIWRGLYFSYLRLFVPCLGLTFCGSAGAYGYILESLKHYPAQQGVADEMQRLGLKTVKIVNLLGGVMSINYGEKPLMQL